MNDKIKIPELVAYTCMNPNHKDQVAEKGGQLLCSDCVNEFLARNVGMMSEVSEVKQKPTVVPDNPVPEGFIPGGDQ
mgnify:CR=1 FL=1